VFKRIEVRPIRKMSRGKTRRANEQPPVKVVRIVPHDGVAALALATATPSAKLGLARPEGFEPPSATRTVRILLTGRDINETLESMRSYATSS
jgi:hypothetical protein